MTLKEINLKYNTDKEKHGYLTIYEDYFSKLQNHKLSILEIGIWSGESLKLWKEYFPNAEIIGIDKSDDCVQCQPLGTTSFLVDQADEKQLIKFSQDKLFDIIIDDGSHYSPHQILSFQVLFERLKPEGLYIVEDIHCSYEQKFGFRGERSINYFLKLAHYLNFRGKLQYVSEYEKNKSDFNGYDGRFKFIHFYPGLCIIKKR